jgi:hypothetical protein
MSRSLLACSIVLAALLFVPAMAQDTDKPPTPPPAGGGGGERAARKPTRDLRFDATPAGWTKVEGGSGKRRFLSEFKLPAAADQAEQPAVTVIGSRSGFADYQAKLRNNWAKADGSALAEADQKTEVKHEAEPEIRVVEQAGTFTPKGGDKKTGMALIAVYVAQGEDKWSVWLMGTAEGVALHKDAFLAWVATAKPGELVSQGGGHGSGGGGGSGGGSGGGDEENPH